MTEMVRKRIRQMIEFDRQHDEISDRIWSIENLLNDDSIAWADYEKMTLERAIKFMKFRADECRIVASRINNNLEKEIHKYAELKVGYCTIIKPGEWPIYIVLNDDEEIDGTFLLSEYALIHAENFMQNLEQDKPVNDMSINHTWKTKSGYEAMISITALGQYSAWTRETEKSKWIEIGAHYSSRENAYEACEELAEKHIQFDATNAEIGETQ